MSDTEVAIDPNPVVGTIEFFNPSYPTGYEVFLPGIGLVENGTTREVTAVQLALFKDAGHVWPDSNKLVIRQEEPSAEDSTVSTQEGSEEGTREEGSGQDAFQEDAEESDS